MQRGPGWYPDPFFRNHERYWDGKWTDECRPLELSRSEPGTTTDPPGTTQFATAKTPVVPRSGPVPVGERPALREDDTLVVPTVPHPDDTATFPAGRAQDPTLAVPRISSNPVNDRDVDAPAGDSSSGASHSQQTPLEQALVGRPAEERPAAPSGTDRRRLVFLGVALALVVTALVVAVVVLTTGGNGRGSKNASARASDSGSSTVPVVVACGRQDVGRGQYNLPPPDFGYGCHV